MAEERMLNDEILLGLIKANSGGGGGGTNNYNDLSNKPQIEGVTLSGNKSASDLGLATTTDLAGKQDKLTAGDYVSINNNTIGVTLEKGQPDVYSYKFVTTSTSDYTPSVKVQKYLNGTLVSETTYENSEVRTPVEFDGRIRFWYGEGGGFVWSYRNLVASNEHVNPTTTTWAYNQTVEYEESFDVYDQSTKLATQGYVDTALADKQDTLTFDDVPTANSNNPVKSGGVKSAIDAAVSSAYHHAGTKTCAELVAGLLVAGNEGNVYNMTDSGTTTADFIEGAGQPIKAGDNVGIAKISDGVYKFDLLSGFVDTTNFVQKSVTAGLLKNDGTVDTNIQGDVDSLKSGLTTLDNEVNGDAVEYPYADVITIPDAVPANLADCTVKIEPVQDLHGYDHPWAGGAGKNKLPLTVDGIKAASGGTWTGNKKTLNSIEIEILTDESNNVTGISAKGTASLETFFTIAELTMGSDEYILNGCPAGGGWGTYFIYWHGTSDPKDMGNGVTINDPNVAGNVQIHISSGYAIDTVFYPMIRLSTETDATFAPYTNICPITGHTEASVQRDGKNMLPLYTPNSVTSNGVTATLNADGSITFSGTATSNASFSIKNNGSLNNNAYASDTKVLDLDADSYYTISKYNDSGKLRILVLAAETPAQSVIVDFINENSGSFKGHPSYKFIMRVNSGTTINETVKLQLEKGSTATSYEPFRGKTYTIALGDTIYGGTVDFDSGVMTVDRAIDTLNVAGIRDTYTNIDYAVLTKPNGSAEKGNYDYFDTITNKYEVASASGDWDNANKIGKMFMQANSNDYWIGFPKGTTQADMYNTVGDLSVCYELATPFTVQLTPTQIQLLKGQNTLTASTGQISVTVNGVSGSIGAVQEQVNELAEEVAEIKPVNYSTTEQKTGQKWIDGKDIYQKVVDFGALPNNTKKSVASGLTGETIVKMYGIAKSGTDFSPLPSTATNAIYTVTLGYDATDHEIDIFTATDMTGYIAYIVLEYTKAT